MKHYKVKDGSIAWYVLKAKRLLQVLGMVVAILAVFAGMSAAAADDLVEARNRELNASKGVEFDAFEIYR